MYGFQDVQILPNYKFAVWSGKMKAPILDRQIENQDGLPDPFLIGR